MKKLFFVAVITVISLLPHIASAQSTEEVEIAKMLNFTNELAEFSNNPETKKIMNVVNSSYNTVSDLKDAFAGGMANTSLNQSGLELVKSISVISKSPKLQKAAKDMDEFYSGYQNIKSNFGSGLDATTSNNLDGIAMGIQALVLLDNLFSKEAQEPTKGQIAAKKYMIFTKEVLEKIYKEYATSPTYNKLDFAALESINKYEKRLENYDKATAKQRLLLLKFIRSKNTPEFTTLQDWVKDIQKSYAEKGLEYIKTEVHNLVKDQTPDYLKNADQGLQTAKATVLLSKYNYYYSTGEFKEAEKIYEQLKGLATTETYNYVKEYIDKAFNNRNYDQAARYYPLFFLQWFQKINGFVDNQKHKNQKLVTADIGINRVQLEIDITTISKGVVALINNNQSADAENYLSQSKTVFADYKKSKNASNVFIPFQGKERMFFNYADGLLLQQKGRFAEALSKMDTAIYYAVNAHSEDGSFIFLIKEAKINLMIQLKQYDEALSYCANTESSYVFDIKDFKISNFKIMKALIFFNMQKFQPALGVIAAIKSIDASFLKAYILEKEIHQAMGDVKAVQKDDQEIQKLYKNK